MTTGNFFAIGRDEWHAATSMGMNPAVVFLVLARATGRDNLTSYAGVQSIEKHTSIVRRRAHKALGLLEGSRLIRSLATTRVKGHPTYELRSLVKRTDRPLIWLPNSLIDGVGGVRGPVEQVRQMQDVMTLRLLVDLYGEHQLAEDGGVKRTVVWQEFDREHLSERGAWSVWGFRLASNATVAACPTTKVHYRKPSTEEAAAGRGLADDFFERLRQLIDCGLAEWIPHVLESDEPDAEPLMALRRTRFIEDEGRPLEERLWTAAYNASHHLLSGNEGAERRADELGLDYRVPLPRSLKKVAMVGILRLRHRPWTSQTSQWWANHSDVGAKWLARYRALEAGSPASISTIIDKSA